MLKGQTRTRLARWLSLRLKKSARLFAGFFDQDTHLRVGGFEVDRPIVVAEAFAGGNTMTQRYLVAKGSMRKLNTHTAWATGTR